MSNNAWCKLIYVGVHPGLLKLSFTFCPFENHYEVHCRYLIAPPGEEFVTNPTVVMSMDPCSTIVDAVLVQNENVSLQQKKATQSRESQINQEF